MSDYRVLLLEDDVALRGLLIEALEAEQYAVVACESFEQLHAAAAAHEGDVVVADFWGTGQRTLSDQDRSQIRELGELLPVVLLTGRSWAAELTAGELGARGLIRKPFDLDHLLGTLQDVLARTQA